MKSMDKVKSLTADLNSSCKELAQVQAKFSAERSTTLKSSLTNKMLQMKLTRTIDALKTAEGKLKAREEQESAASVEARVHARYKSKLNALEQQVANSKRRFEELEAQQRTESKENQAHSKMIREMDNFLKRYESQFRESESAMYVIRSLPMISTN